MDRIFKEEQDKLSEIEHIIDDAADAVSPGYKELVDELREYYPINYEDVCRKKELIDQKNKYAELRQQYIELKPSPYFAHLKFEQNDHGGTSVNDYFIGNKGLVVGSNVIILDWRSEIGQWCYEKRNNSFNINKIIYTLYLRRRLHIQNERLISYKNEYEKQDVKLGGEVVDDFLLSVLHDKRRNPKLSDIIKTIQANQNYIIRRPSRESFIVQGCAGSGKSMILLHRLSYLAYNKMLPRMSSVKIITPHQDFKTFINDLSVQLEIQAIQQLTVEEYYVKMIKKHSPHANASATVASENAINPKLVGEIYSINFMTQLQSQYNEYWTTILNSLDERKLRALFGRYSIKYPDTTNHDSQAVYALKDGIERIIAKHEDNTKTRSAAQARKSAKVMKYGQIYQLYLQDKKHMPDKQNDYYYEMKKLRDEIKELEDLIISLIDEDVDYCKYCKSEVEKLEEDVLYQQVIIENVKKMYETYEIKYRDKNYRYILYLKLLLCSLYYGHITIGDDLVNVDEAQDISISEYTLLRKVLGDKCVFNLYGDVQQAINVDKCITDWNMLNNIVSNNVYSLKENYRNTVQITEYCNAEFRNNTTAIGIAGTAVSNMTLSESTNWLTNLKRRNPEYRVAIIVHGTAKAVRKRLMAILGHEALSVNTVNNKAISLLSVEHAKGMEFEAVVVIREGMTDNERYIAYTRALEYLCVVQ